MRKSWISMGLLLAVFAIFFGTAVGTSVNLTGLLECDAQRSEALRSETELQRLLTLLVDIETGQRGFMITGQQEFLEPYRSAVRDLDLHYGQVRDLLARAGIANGRLLRLETSIQQRIAQVERNIELREAYGTTALHNVEIYTEGKVLMDELRGEVADLQREQQQRIVAIDAQAAAVQDRVHLLTLLLPPAGMAILLLALTLLLLEKRQRDKAETALQHVNANLEQQVHERTQALTQALQRIQGFAQELDRGVEDERRRLARDVHDQIGQVSTSIKMLTIALRSKLKSHTDPLVDELQAMADEAIRSARQISAALRPPLLDELGLKAALGHYLEVLGRQSGLRTTLDLSGAEALPPEQANPLFRIVQEACTNVLRHAGATSLIVRGGHLMERGLDGYELQIVDDGRGPGDVRADASGLRNMRERAALAGGVFEFGPAPERGSCVRVWVPLEAPRQGRALPLPETEVQA